MKKTYKLQDLDCANCAAKMQDAISKIQGVENASVNFMMQKLSFETTEELLPTVLEDIKKAISKVEPDCRLLV